MLVRGAGIIGGIVLGTGLDVARPVFAKAAKSEFLYQDHPHDGKTCASCRFFSPDERGGESGNCAVIEGPVNRDGWCLAYAPKT